MPNDSYYHMITNDIKCLSFLKKDKNNSKKYKVQVISSKKAYTNFINTAKNTHDFSHKRFNSLLFFLKYHMDIELYQGQHIYFA
jgi:hypothetical protein